MTTNKTKLNEDNQPDNVHFLVDVNPNYQDKVKPGSREFYRFNMSFQTKELDLEGLLAHIMEGHAWTAPHHKELIPGRKTYRNKQNVFAVQLLGLDFDTEDERSSLDALASDPFLAKHAAILHTTASHTEEKPRARAIIALSSPLEPDEAELATKALLEDYPHADQSAKDISRVFYGAYLCDVRMPGNILDVDQLREEVIAPYQQRLDQEIAERERLRVEALARLNGNGRKSNAQKEAYVAGAYHAILDEVGEAQPGTGERHTSLRNGATRLASLQKADWHTTDSRQLLDAWPEILAAAASSYSQDYGQDEVRRIIASGQAIATPAIEPIWNEYQQDYFKPGDYVSVTHNGKVLATGFIDEMRQAPDAEYWLALVVGVWYPREWLNHIDGGQDERQQPEIPEKPITEHIHSVTGKAPKNSEKQPLTTAELDDNHSRICAFKKAPPAPELFPEGWQDLALDEDEDEGLAGELFATMLDGKQRNIYAGLTTGPALEVDVAPGEYLTARALPYDQLPRFAMLNANTGIGKTSYALGLHGQKIIVTSSTLALEQILERQPDAHAYYHDIKTATEDSQTIVTTYESFQRVLEIVDASQYYLIVDEAHNFAASSHKAFRGAALEGVMDTMNGQWRGVLLMTGTPAPLCHPYLAKFTPVNVRSYVRGQNAQRVIWQDEDGKGKRLNAVMERVEKDQAHFVFLNDKKQQERLKAGLIAAGWKDEEIAILNSENKHEAAGRAIVEQERVPDEVKILISTSVAVEALNLRDRYECVHIVTDIHPYLAQQLVNRLRTAAAGVVYWYNAGSGRGYDVDARSFQRHFLKHAQNIAAELNTHASVNPNDTSQEAIKNRRSLRLWSKDAMQLVRVDEDVETSRKWYDVSYLGVDQTTFESIAEYTRKNPQAFKNALLPFGWQWLPDEEHVVAKLDPATAGKQKEIATQLREEREKQHQERLEAIREAGLAAAKESARKHEDTKIMKASQDVIRLYEAFRPSDMKHHEAFLAACELVAEANESQRRINRLARQIKVQHLRQQQDQFTQQLVNAFQPGERLNSEEVQERVVTVYEQDEVMELEVRRRKLYPFSTEVETSLTPRKAVEVLKDLWHVKRTSVRVPGEATPVHVYEIVDQHELAEIVATLAGYIDIPRKVATKSQALAFDHVATLQARQDSEVPA